MLYLLIIIAIVVALVIPITISVRKEKLKMQKIISRAASTSAEQLEAIYNAIEKSGTEVPNAAIFARLHQTCASTDVRIIIPDFIEPWSGMAIDFTFDKDVTLSLVKTAETSSSINGRQLRKVLVPRNRSKAGKLKNTYSPNEYFKKIPEVASACEKICPEFPSELLGYLFNISRECYYHDPIDQIRIGGSPSWIQNPEYELCPICKKRMSHIAQIPSEILPTHWKAIGDFYLMGCKKHPGQICTINQFT